MKPVSHLEKASSMAKMVKAAAQSQMKYIVPMYDWNWYTGEIAKYILKTIKNTKNE